MIRRAGMPVLAIMLATAGSARGQERAQPPSPREHKRRRGHKRRATQETIEPDRPDVTNGTHIVDIGLLQVEIGGLYTHAGADQQAFGSPFTARLGLLPWLEARIGTDGFLSQSDPLGSVTGLGNLQLGAKMRLWANPGGVPVLSILPTVNVPTASADKGLGSGDADYTLAVLTGTDIGSHGHVDVNYGIGAIGAGGARCTSRSISCRCRRALPRRTSGIRTSRRSGSLDRSRGAAPSPRSTSGRFTSWGRDSQSTAASRFGVSGSAPNLAAFGGLSIIVGDVLGKHGVHARQRHAQERARGGRPSTRR